MAVGVWIGEETLLQTGLIKRRRLTESEQEEIRVLQETCNQAEGLRIKFNWSLMRERLGIYESDFCYYEDGKLVGYAPLDGFGGPFEVTAAVLPTYRRRGTFHALFTAAIAEARRCQATELLLVSYPASPDGSAVVRHLGLPYKSSEYRMEAQSDTIPPLTESALRLEPVDSSNVGMLSRLLAISFGDSAWNMPESLLQELEKPNKRYFLAKREEITLGQIGVITQDKSVYIQAVGIAPEWRNRGYGRQLLAATVHKMLLEGYIRFALDVATDNPHALSLYHSCGFHQVTAYDYYTVPLYENERSHPEASRS